MVLHGTNGFPHSIMKGCVEHGMTRCNVNEWVLHKYNAYAKENTGKVPLTVLMEEGSKLIQGLTEELIDVLGSRGKA
jgi:fructose-bisphosphate aldolase class II